jgi:hypothetical protein
MLAPVEGSLRQGIMLRLDVEARITSFLLSNSIIKYKSNILIKEYKNYIIKVYKK